MDIITRNNVENLKNGLIKFQLNNNTSNNYNKNNCNHNNNNNNNFNNYKNINNNKNNNVVIVDGGDGGGGGGGGGEGVDYTTTDNLKCNGHIEIDTNCNNYLEQRRQKCAERTTIQEFYNKKNILVTGGTGFMGKMLIEKLLRSCPDIENIYMLVRPKKGKDIHTRLDEIFDDQVYSTVREQVPKFRHKIVAIPGDCAVAGLGLKLLDRQTLIENVNIIFHAAATVRFDEKLRLAININVHGTKELLNLCTHMKNLNVMMHISTAYSNCHLYYIEEKFYKYPFHFDDVNRLIDKLDDKSLDEATPTVLGKWPNTYAFTKALAEEMIRKNCHNLPIGMFRPAIVTSTIKEPVVGWIDNLYGPTGVVAGVGTGVLRTMHCDKDIVANIVPVDMTVNALIASAWDVATNFYNNNNNNNSRRNFNNINNNYNNIKMDDSNYVINDSNINDSNNNNNNNNNNNKVDDGGTTVDSNNNNNNNNNNDNNNCINNCNNNCNNNATNDEIIPIYNYVSSVENPLTWGRFTELNITYGFDYPFSSAIWYLSFHMHKTAMMNKIYMIFLHILPAMLFDSLAICVGQRPQLLKAYKKIHKFSSVISFFCTNEWLFTNDNVQCLWNKLSDRDQDQFGFNMKTIDWKEYAHYYIKGMRLYLFKDDLTTVESARKKWNRFYWLHQLLKAFFLFIIIFLLWSTFSHYIYHIF